MTTVLPPPRRTPASPSTRHFVTGSDPLTHSDRYSAGRDDAAIRAHAHLAARFGRTGLAPFLAAPEVHVVDLAGGFGAAGYARRGRWAVTAGDVVAPEPLADRALSQYLHILDQRRLKAAFVAISDPAPFRRRGFAVSEIADEAILDLKNFGLSGKARANLRHAVASARRAGLTVSPTSRGRTSRSVRCPPRG